MRNLDWDGDEPMNSLERDWREAYESGIVARSFYQTLAARPDADSHLLEVARERIARIDALKARIAAKIRSAEDQAIARISPWRSAASGG